MIRRAFAAPFVIVVACGAPPPPVAPSTDDDELDEDDELTETEPPVAHVAVDAGVPPLRTRATLVAPFASGARVRVPASSPHLDHRWTATVLDRAGTAIGTCAIVAVGEGELECTSDLPPAEIVGRTIVLAPPQSDPHRAVDAPD